MVHHVDALALKTKNDTLASNVSFFQTMKEKAQSLEFTGIQLEGNDG